jgi:hypothetical protein
MAFANDDESELIGSFLGRTKLNKGQRTPLARRSVHQFVTIFNDRRQATPSAAQQGSFINIKRRRLLLDHGFPRWTPSFTNLR